MIIDQTLYFFFFFLVFLIHTGAKCRRYAFVNPQGCCFAWDGKWANGGHNTSTYLTARYKKDILELGRYPSAQQQTASPHFRPGHVNETSRDDQGGVRYPA